VRGNTHHCFLTSDDMLALGELDASTHQCASLATAMPCCVGWQPATSTPSRTDPSPHLPSEKAQGRHLQAVSGFAAVEISLRLFLTCAFTQDGCRWNNWCGPRLYAPARVWDLYPAQGARLHVGSDADMVVVDLELEDTIRLSECTARTI